jgi:hypothetical protein
MRQEGGGVASVYFRLVPITSDYLLFGAGVRRRNRAGAETGQSPFGRVSGLEHWTIGRRGVGVYLTPWTRPPVRRRILSSDRGGRTRPIPVRGASGTRPLGTAMVPEFLTTDGAG